MNDFDENVLQQGEEKEFPWQDVLELTNGRDAVGNPFASAVISVDQILEDDQLKTLQNVYFNDAEFQMREVEKRSLEICKDKPFEFHTEDFKFRQKYVKRYDAYKQPDVYAFRKTKCKKINYELNETTVKKLQNIAKQQKFAISDIVNVICDTLPTDVYENYYQGERLNQIAKKLRQLAREEYEKHKGEKIELTIEKLAEKCGLMSGNLDKSTHKSL